MGFAIEGNPNYYRRAATADFSRDRGFVLQRNHPSLQSRCGRSFDRSGRAARARTACRPRDCGWIRRSVGGVAWASDQADGGGRRPAIGGWRDCSRLLADSRTLWRATYWRCPGIVYEVPCWMLKIRHDNRRECLLVPPGSLVVAEMHGGGLQPANAFERLQRRRHVVHHRRARRLALEHLDRPAGVPGNQRRAVRGVDLDALVANRVPRRGDRSNARNDLGLAVQQLEARAGIFEPRSWRLVGAAIFVLGSLQVDGRLRKDRVLAAVIEMEVRVDDPANIGRIHVVFA